MRPYDEEGAQLFGETLGHLLERHCLDVAESVIRRSSGQSGSFQSSDIAQVMGPGSTAQTSSSLTPAHQRSSRSGLDGRTFRTPCSAVISKATTPTCSASSFIGQSNSTAKSTTRSTATSSCKEHRPDCLRRVHPVVCLWDGFPLGRYLYQRIEKALGMQGSLQQPEVAPLSIISVQDFEQLLGRVSQGDSVTDILQLHAGHSRRTDERLLAHHIRSAGLFARLGG